MQTKVMGYLDFRVPFTPSPNEKVLLLSTLHDQPLHVNSSYQITNLGFCYRFVYYGFQNDLTFNCKAIFCLFDLSYFILYLHNNSFLISFFCTIRVTATKGALDLPISAPPICCANKSLPPVSLFLTSLPATLQPALALIHAFFIHPVITMAIINTGLPKQPHLILLSACYHRTSLF